MTDFDFNGTLWDSTAGDTTVSDLREFRRIATQRSQQKLYGHSHAFRQEELRKKVEAEVKHRDDALELNARDYQQMDTALVDAKQHIREWTADASDYAYVAHSETVGHLRHFYDWLTVRPEIQAPALQFSGVPVIRSKSVPEGWIVLADRTDDDNMRIRTRPLAVITNADAGSRETIGLTVGGELRLRVIL